MCIKIARRVANNVDPDQMLHSAASDRVLHCLFRPIFPNTLGNYGRCIAKAHNAIVQEKAKAFENNYMYPK